MTESKWRRPPLFGRVRHIHMVGIGGIGMSSIAEILLLRGFRVTGSDLKRSEITERLERLGATVYEGHHPEHIEGADIVVYSSAVRPQENPETLEALRRRIPLIPRAEMLGELMRMKFGIGVAGTHGKTTTTSMVGLVVAEGGFDPTIIVGGKVTAFDSNAVAGEGDIIVIEADEYDRTFLRLTPTWAVITSIEAEHLDIYRDLDDLLEAFCQFASSVPFFGATILCLDDPNVQTLVGKLDRRTRTYGLARQAEVRAENIRFEGFGSSFEVVLEGVSLGEIRLQVPGLHNVRNALAAVTVGLELDIPFARIRAGLERFTGVRRRFERLGEVQGILVIDDYAHHPTEIRVTLEAAATAMPDRRLVAVFQPHLYSRTRDFQEEFARAFVDADVLVVTEIYGAREAPIPGISGAGVAELARRFGHRDVHYVPDRVQLPLYLQERVLRPGDAVLFLGAGDIWRAARELLESLSRWKEAKSQSISTTHAAP
jgi:UDP-N-acetylmuramate--alanine ligase